MKQFLFLLIFLPLLLKSQTPTIGLINHTNESSDGYILFTPNGYTSTYLIDKCGYLVKEWTGVYKPANSVYLNENGELIRPGNLNNSAFALGGGAGGIIVKKSWENEVLWSYSVSTNLRCFHHDVYPLPNGNILAIVWQKMNKIAAINAGRDSTKIGQFLWDEQIVEIKPIGNDSAEIVWQWNLWDHLIQDYDPSKENFGIVADHPEKINVNIFSTTPMLGDWVHLNSVAYNEDKDQIIVSSRIFSEIWIIDHSTNTLEASGSSGGNAGKGGDLLFRWGNPQNYQHGTSQDQKLFGQHSAHWIDNDKKDGGKIMVFNNGKDRPEGDFSSVEIINPIMINQYQYAMDLNGKFLPDTAEWIYSDQPETHLFSANISGAMRVENGNTIICDGDNGHFYEIDTLGNKLWEYINPVNSAGPQSQGSTISLNSVFRIHQYPLDYQGFTGRTLLPWMPLETNPYNNNCEMISTSIKENQITASLIIFPNPGDGRINFNETVNQNIKVCSPEGKIIANYEAPINELDLQFLDSGIYFLIGNKGGMVKIVITH